MTYDYVGKVGGTHNGIYLTCPKCKSEDVVLIVLEDGRYGVEGCNKCDYKNKEVYAHLNGKAY
jgi:Zn ribbon nucleic-acid-binding protein